MNYIYCKKECVVGIKKSEELLEAAESARDAAIDFMCFVDECFEKCPHKDKHTEAAE